jgi:hypothetical protein
MIMSNIWQFPLKRKVLKVVTWATFDIIVYVASWERLLVSNKREDCFNFSGGRLAEEISTDFHLCC